MLTLNQRLEAGADRGHALTFVVGGDHVPVPYAQLHEEARAVAANLQGLGVAPGDHVAILGPTSRPLVTAIQGVWLAGATVVVLPLPMRMSSIEEFVHQTRVRITNADATLVLVDPDLAPFIEATPGDPPMVGWDALAGPGRAGAEAWERPTDDLDRLAILQFTSGSTSDPKGVMLPHRTVGANLDAIIEATSLDPDDDVLVSWLPLYHDMGLVGLFTLSLSTGTPLVLGAPTDFMAGPSRWMEWMSTYGGTATAGPNFSYVLATRALHRAEQLDLSRLRIALNGAEPVDPATVHAFVEAGARHGLRPGAVFPAFGMAEVAIAGTFPEPMSGLRTDPVDRRVLESERYAAPVDGDAEGVRHLAILGRPVPGLEVRVVDPVTGDVLREREVGELEISGTSVTPGYYRRPEANAELFHDGWLRTGDLAYLVDGEMVMCGRIKDMIIVGGRNVYPEDVERALAEVEGVRAGNVIAFGVEHQGKEGLVVVAESKSDDHDGLRRTVAERVRIAVGLPAKDIVLVEPGSLPKTSSGKLQRSLCKLRYLGAELPHA
ncbi:MAG TPA: fatty acyl-AMP ligase [Acidimicrobiales bacterium]|nr:fatty acyl-AMP ligase [Acidimicrobiales bacterium]